jgi:DNA-binding response OmpR family regulator
MPGRVSGDAAHHTGRILVVEDDAVQAQVPGVVLCREGYTVETATTGAEAVGGVVERRQLLVRAWGDVYARRLRKKIEPDPDRPRYLHTVWGVGYRLAEEPATVSAGSTV